MPDAPNGIAGARLRANPDYELVLLDRLAPAERRRLGDLEDDPDLYGVLRPRPGTTLEPRSATSDTALLFLTLAEPGPLPAYVRARLGGDEAERTVGRLVLDGVLEVEVEGRYVAGGRAALLLAPTPSEGGRNRIGELSRAALRYGQELVGLPEPMLAQRLYCYGRLPVATLRRRLPDQAAVEAFLGLHPGGPARAALDGGWHELPPPPGVQSQWRRWRARRAPQPHTDPAGATCKLYVSPAPDALADAIATVASSLARARGVAGLKVGADAHGICRPDKLVVHFHRLDDLQAAAALLGERLDGCPAHAVPFTAAITHDGLLSWGADPPASEGASWRMWVTARLAEHLTAAGTTDDGALEPWQFALERMRMSGVDTDTWAPASAMWHEALAAG